ncbi:MAG: hypothetical protein JST00_42955 [Deltaproteobacteria bacterium]|nr:hypothetical protein [Deltaproteobacteria bacterium]
MKPSTRASSLPSFSRHTAGTLSLLLLAGASAAVMGCSSSEPGTQAAAPRDDARAPEGETPTDDGGATVDGSSSDAGADATTEDATTQGPCPTPAANEAVYCQNFDTAPLRVGVWTLRGEPKNDDAGVPQMEDTTQFWSAPRSRYLSSAGEMLRGSAAGPLPVVKSRLRFRARPEFDPFNTNGTYLAYVGLGDSTLSVAWIDYGKLDPSKSGMTGYALIHHVFGVSKDTWTPLPKFPAKNVWSAVELSLESSGAASIYFDGTLAAQLTVTVAPSTSADFGFGAYYSSSSGSPSVLSANIDDVAAVITR